MLPFTHANKHTRARKQGNTQLNEMHIFLAHTYTHTLSSRQQGPVSDHDGARICSVVRANDLRHMSSPCGFKTKHCQERSALAGHPAPRAAVLGMRRAIQSSKSKTKPIIVLSHCSVLCAYRLLQTPRVLPPSERLLADLPARLERGPRHPGDGVHSHYPLWEKPSGGPGMGERKGMGEEGREDRKEQNRKKVCASICEERPRTW